MLYALALLAGIVAGSRTFTAPAAVSWAATLGALHLEGTWLAFMASLWAAWIFTALAIVEFVMDQLPSTPSRKVPMQFGARIVSGALCGATIGASGGVVDCGARRRRHRRRDRNLWRRRDPRPHGQGLWARPAGRRDRGRRGGRPRPHRRGGAPMSRRFDAIVVGAGQAGPPMAARLAAAGRTVALIERERSRRHLRQHRLHADQDAGGERLRRASGAPRRRFRRQRGARRRRFRRRHGAKRSGRRRQALGPRVLAAGHEELHGDPRPRAVRLAPRRSRSEATPSRPTRSSSMSAAARSFPTSRASIRSAR